MRTYSMSLRAISMSAAVIALSFLVSALPGGSSAPQAATAGRALCTLYPPSVGAGPLTVRPPSVTYPCP